ncbi:class GN sortase [uncultured Shewanella sp.]|uniref:class GN sortase n=1 Tax=Shewanella atlantica TaxID=271099 RepID=UPI0026261A62|nr:class GN sortase [uncultured Shewanella sp.]
MKLSQILHLTLIGSILIFSLTLIGKGTYMQAKAHFAQYLIMQAWEQTLEDSQPHKPWSWADTYPVSKMTFIAEGEESTSQRVLYVLAGASGRNLAFGPAELDINSQKRGGNRVIAGHNDTHFSILSGVKTGRQIRLQDASGNEQLYRVTETLVVHESDTRVLEPSNDKLLTLITCYPFNSLEVGGALRLVVKAEAVIG